MCSHELLDGSGYNILLIGDLGQGTPRRIVLSGRPTGPAPASGNASPGATNDNDAENDQEAEQPGHESAGTAAHARSPL